MLFTPVAASASPTDIIICGSGGDDTYRELFLGWGRRLEHVLIERMERSQEDVVLLDLTADEATSGCEASALESIRSIFQDIPSEDNSSGDVYIYLLGHGSYWKGVSRFHIPGPDLTDRQLGQWIDGLENRRVVLINASSSSAGFINSLSRPGRIVCTATKSIEERNAPVFMEYFIQALEDGSADRNRDERISVLEACKQAAALTDAHYLSAGLIATEHALIDDNGDGLGTRLLGELMANPAPESEADSANKATDGALAARVYMKDFSFPDSVPRELVERYRTLLGKVEALKSEKSAMAGSKYYTDLEALLLQTARVRREIRRAASSGSLQQAVSPVE